MYQRRISHQLTESVKLLQKAVLIHSGSFLILQRDGNSQSRPFCWDLAGGNSEWPDTANENLESLHQQDISREIKEETGITVIPEHFTQQNLVSFKTFFESKQQLFSIIVGWKVELPEEFDISSVILSSEHVAYKWITLGELNDYDFGGLRGDFIKEMIRNSIQ